MNPEEILKTRIRALDAARDMRPSPTYAPLGQLGQQPMQPYYELLKEAENIYQWIVGSDSNNLPYKIGGQIPIVDDLRHLHIYKYEDTGVYVLCVIVGMSVKLYPIKGVDDIGGGRGGPIDATSTSIKNLIFSGKKAGT